MDIGGGSVEFVICNRDQIFWKKSFDIGAQRLLDWFHNIDPIPQNEIDKINAFFDKELTPLKEQLGKYNPKDLIGSSGTFDTLSEIYQHKKNRFLTGDETELLLTVAGFEEIYHEIITKGKTERLKIPGMIEMRVDMIVVASCLVKYILDITGIEHVRVSAHSLKEGMIYVIQQEMIRQDKLSASGN
jgi:exopolyphosphatase / guanosine-5'-triphosphate,3'-diphosphate pyrophosphatase